MRDRASDHIVKRLSQYICDANADIMRFTKNRSYVHDTGSEGYISGYIANRIFSENLLIDDEYCDYVRLEVGVSGHLGEALADERTSGRFDIVCFNEGDDPLLIVEVKRHFSPSGLKADASRLVNAIKSNGVSVGGTLKGAAMVAITSGWGIQRTTADVQLEQVEATIRDYENGIHTWGGVCEMPILIEGDQVPKRVTGFAVLIKG